MNTKKLFAMTIPLACGVGSMAAVSQAAQIAKFDRQPPDVTYTSTASMYDIERCLIRLTGAGGVPHVYAQADRPLQSMIIWVNDNNDAGARVDLIGDKSATKILAWRAVHKNPEEFEACAPHSK